MHFSDILPCMSSDAFLDHDTLSPPSATTTMISAGSETNAPSFTTADSVTAPKKWRARALSPIRVPRSLRIWSSAPPKETSDEVESSSDIEVNDCGFGGCLPSPVLRVSSRPTEVRSPTQTWNRGGNRTLPSLDGMVFEERGRQPMPTPTRRTRPVSSIIPMSAAARAMEVQAFATETTLYTSSHTDSSEEVRTIRDVDIDNGIPPLSAIHVFDSQSFNVRVDPSFMTTCNVVRPAADTQGRRLRRCLSVPRDLGRAFQSFSCIRSDDIESPNKENMRYDAPKSARPEVTSFDKGKETEKVIPTATWASIFGLMEAPSKRRSAVFGKLADEIEIVHGQLFMPEVNITVTRTVTVQEVEYVESPSNEVSIMEVQRY